MERFETCIKNEEGKFIFIGWHNINENEEFCINIKETKKFIYKTYKWLNNTIDIYRFRKQGVEI